MVVCFLGAVFRHSLPYAPSDVVRGVSGVALAILFFAVVVPVEPGRMAVAAVLSALMDPVGLWFAISTEATESPPWNLWLWLMAPNVIVVALAILTSRFLYSLNEAVTRAREVGSYKLVERLGAGGMGEVWRAEHRTLARPAAIKLVKAEALGASREQSERTLQRFEREARATAGLESPHTIEVYDFGTAQDGSFFYVMELLHGMDLETLVQRFGPIPPSGWCTSCSKPVTLWRTRISRAWCTAILSPPTSTCAGAASTWTT